MKHKDIKELLPLYLDDELNKKEKELLEDHLKECPACRHELKDYQENQQLISSLEEYETPEDFLPSVMKQIKESENNKVEKSGVFFSKLKNIFSVPVKIPAGVLGITALIILIVVGGLTTNLFQGNYPAEPEQYYKSDLTRNKLMQTEEAPLPYGEALDKENPQTPSAAREAKIIKKANLRLEIKDIEESSDWLLNITENNKGYVAHSNNWSDENNNKYHSYQLRIPIDQFNNVLSLITEYQSGKVISRSIWGEDVTEEYTDLQIRIKNLKLQEERYRELLNKALTVEDILGIEKELERVRLEIERLEGRLNYLNNQVTFSTIDVQLQQVGQIGPGNWGFIKALRDALQAMTNNIYRLIIVLGSSLPYLLILTIIYLIWKNHK